jgi:hypothetical protein
MPFKSGKSGNVNGRPTGAKGKRTLEWEQLGDFITSEGAMRAIDILKKQKDNDFLKNYNALLEYFKPKQQRTEIDGKGEIKIIWNEELTNETDGKTDKGV